MQTEYLHGSQTTFTYRYFKSLRKPLLACRKKADHRARGGAATTAELADKHMTVNQPWLPQNMAAVKAKESRV